MAFYQDVNDKRNRADKRQAAEQRGGFDDEGAHYSSAKPPRGNRPAQGGFAPRGDRPAQGGFAPRGDRPAKGGFAPRGERPAQGGFAPRGDRPAQGGFAPRGDRPAQGGFAPRGDRPSRDGFAPRGERTSRDGFAPRGDRPSRDGFAPRGDRPPREGFAPRGDRPAQGGFAPRGDRPPRDGFAPRGGRSSRDQGDYRFTKSDQQPYRSRGNDTAPRSYHEQRSERREAPAPVAKDYHAFRYEAPQRAPQPTYDAPAFADEEIVPNENLLSGRNPIREALKSGRDIEKLLVARGDLSGSAREIIAMAKEQHVPVQEVDRARLDAITQNHQGMLAFASAYQYHTVEEMLALAQERGQEPFLVVLDGLTDPHNLGAIIRTAECAGAHGVIVQERRAVGLTPAAVKASAGAIEHMMVARVTNLTATLALLKKHNIWVYAADMEGEDYTAVDFKGGAAIVIGAEGEGVSRLVLENADKRVALPVRGQLDSLNASVAAGILLYAVLRSR